MLCRAEGVTYRAEKGIKRYKKTPPEDNLPEKKQQKNQSGTCKVRFSKEDFHEREVKIKNLLGRACVLSIKLDELARAHYLEANS